jgi:hypothetical protein
MTQQHQQPDEKATQDDGDTSREEELDEMLDEAVEESMPASDPIAVHPDPFDEKRKADD